MIVSDHAQFLRRMYVYAINTSDDAQCIYKKLFHENCNNIANILMCVSL